MKRNRAYADERKEKHSPGMAADHGGHPDPDRRRLLLQVSEPFLHRRSHRHRHCARPLHSGYHSRDTGHCHQRLPADPRFCGPGEVLRHPHGLCFSPDVRPPGAAGSSGSPGCPADLPAPVGADVCRRPSGCRVCHSLQRLPAVRTSSP